ncbi:MAG: UPF0104 family protein [Roseofilum sp. Belize BBD 4]|nr:UPF0104 family protein [Roseofilum sp. Belize BBD 4]HBQ97175.1 hypothetical protein [Cyanobacteria bacterium UBA11691]
MKSLVQGLLSSLKPYLRWFIVGAALFFLAQAFKDHWQEVLTIRISGWGWISLAIALLITIAAHIWSGWIWGWILAEFNQRVKALWSIQTYLITNIGKYLPGNVWHFYGRIRAAQSIDVPQVIAILSTLMEPLLMAASALILAAGTSLQTRGLLQGVTLVIVLIGVHPRILNPMLTFLSKKKAKGGLAAQDQTSAQLKRYPLKPLLGEMGFLLIRGLGFLFALAALSTIEMAQVPQLLSAFSCAWLLGLVIPGAPGGLGVFEATAIALLDGVYPSAIILSGVALYRVISVLSEAIGALLAWLYQAFNSGDFLKVD